MNRILSRLTYANVMATVAVFIALGGASYAAIRLPKSSVGTKQLKNGAVTAAKIKHGAVTAKSIAAGAVTQEAIDPSKLGTVPSATNADHATSADNAGALQGMTAAQIGAGSKLRCPAGTMAAGGLCVEDTSRSKKDFFQAERICAEAGRLLPPESALSAFLLPAVRREEGTPTEWAVGGGGLPQGYARTLDVENGALGFQFGIGLATETEPQVFRCAALPTN